MMQFKRLLLVAVGLLSLGIGAVPAQAQLAWFAYLFSGSDKSLLRVDQSGQQTPYTLGLGPNEYTGTYNMSFSADGSRVGFCTIGFNPSDQLGTATAYVRNIAGQRNQLAANLGKTMSCQTSRQSLSADGSLLAVSLTNYFIGDTQADTSRPAWQLLVLDATSGSVVHELNANSPNAPDAGGDFSLSADVGYFDNAQLVFGAIPYGTDSQASTPAYDWQFDTGALTPVDNWGHNGMVFIQETGELAWADSDTSLSAGNPGGPIPATNVVMLADKTGPARRIYHSPDWLISGLHFVNGGRDLAILLSSPYDPNQPGQQMFFKWVLLDRTGVATELPNNSAVYSDMGDAPDGYAMMWEEFVGGDPTNPAYHLDLTSGGQTSEIWSVTATGTTTNWELAWTLPSPTASDLTPFPANSG